MPAGQSDDASRSGGAGSLLSPRWLLALVFLVYLFFPAPPFQWGDGLELVAVSAHLGVPHPTGYPVYTLLAFVVQKLSLGTPYGAVLLISRIASIFMMLAFYSILLRLLRRDGVLDAASNWIAGLFTLAVGFSDLLRASVLQAEVYALNGALIMGIVALIGVRPSQEQRTRHIVASACLMGLAASNHLTSLCMLPLVVLSIFGGCRGKVGLLASSLVIMALLPVILYGSLMLRVPGEDGHGIYWGETSDLTNLFIHLRGGEYRNFQFMQAAPGHPFTPSLYLTFVLVRTLHLLSGAGAVLVGSGPTAFLIGIPVLLWGIAGLWRFMRSPGFGLQGIGLLAAVLLQLLFIFTYNIPDIRDYFLGILILLLPFALATGLRLLGSVLLRRGFGGFECARMAVVVAGLFAAIGCISLRSWWQASQNGVPRLWLDRLVSALPPGAAVITAGDADIYSLWYLQFAEKQRTDVFVYGGNFTRFPWFRRSLPPGDERRSLVAFRERAPGTLTEYVRDLRSHAIDPLLKHGPVYTTISRPEELRELAKTYSIQRVAELLSPAELEQLVKSGEFNIGPPALHEILPRENRVP